MSRLSVFLGIAILFFVCTAYADCGSCTAGTHDDTDSTESTERPRYFKDQVLTDDDLQILSDYTVAKPRLKKDKAAYGVDPETLVDQHPGVEHQAGTKDGGTYIIVHDDEEADGE